MPTNTEYAYAVTKIRAIENRLLGKESLYKMIEAKTLEDTLKVIVDAGYGADSVAANVYDYENLLREEQKKLYGLLKDIAPKPDLFDMFMIMNDYHNIKVILKSEFLLKENDHLLVDTGTIPVNSLKTMIKERKMANMHPVMREAVLESIDNFNRVRDSQNIDVILDFAGMKQMVTLAKESGNEFLVNIAVIIADLTNISSFLRVRHMKKSWDFLKKVLVDGGSIGIKFFMEKLQDPLESFIEKMRAFRYEKVCEEGAAWFQKTGRLDKYEKMADEYVLSFVKKARYTSFGIEPLVGYLVLKENEIKNVRIIMTGKINGIPSEIIKERLRDTYA